MIESNAQATELGGTGRKSRAIVKIPVLGRNPKFAIDTYSLDVDQVLSFMWGYLFGSISSIMPLTIVGPFQTGEIIGENYPFSSQLAFPSPLGLSYSLIPEGKVTI